jgi:hypothetical protein
LTGLAIDFDPSRDADCTLSRAFFHYTEYACSPSDYRRIACREGHSPRRDCLLGRAYIEANAHRIARSYLSAHVCENTSTEKIYKGREPTIVIHLRAGDISNLDSAYYITNPLHYYLHLSRRYTRAIIVTEPGPRHILLPSILALFPHHEVTTGSVNEDFQSLLHAHHLATSGVGTFAVAAALLSRRLQRFHCSDLFQIEHLNPRMLDPQRVEVCVLPLRGFVSRWRRSTDRRRLLLEWQPSQANPAPASAGAPISSTQGGPDRP